MKYIEMLYGDRVSMEAGFYRHAFGLTTWDETKNKVVVNTGCQHEEG